jgi:gliding motility-associated lipoprotein GldH
LTRLKRKTILTGVIIRRKREGSMANRTNNYFLIVLLASLTLLLSCNRDLVFTDTHEMQGKTWKLDDTPVFDVPISDTITRDNVIFTIRTGSSYPFRNIYLFVTTTSPDGKVMTDTLQYFLADDKGNWLGKGFGDIHELSLPYKSNVFFPAKGIYRFRIQHGMRVGDLKGVYDFGLRIEKYSK